MGRVLDVADGRTTVEQVASILQAGGVAVFPTDTVYGIAQAVASNPQGPRRLFSIKRRPPSKTVPWLVAGPADLELYGSSVPPWAFCLAERLWPGGLTLVVPASRYVPAPYRGADDTIALRVPDSPFVHELVGVCASPLATTSANTSGEPAPTSFAELEPRIISEADIAVDGGSTPGALSSTVVLCTGERPVVSRVGAVANAVILQIAGF